MEIKELYEFIKDFKDAVIQRFEGVDERFKSIDRRFEDLEKNIDKRFEDQTHYIHEVETRIREDMSAGFTDVNARLDGHEVRLQNIEHDVKFLKDKTLELEITKQYKKSFVHLEAK